MKNMDALRIILNDNLEKKEFKYTRIPYSKYYSKYISTKYDHKQKTFVDIPNKQLNYTSAKNINVINDNSNNHFINTFLIAYNNHIDLTLSPDDILISIGSVISTEINNNSEKYRNRFVNHEDKKELTIILDILNWDKFIDGIHILLKNEVISDLTKLIVPEFSTTTDIERIVGQCTVMDCFKEYFSYNCCIYCGIRGVNLRGTHEDWYTLRDKYIKIKEIIPELKWWYKYFDVIIDMFVQMRTLSVKGEIQANKKIVDLWSRAITEIPYGSGMPRISGWVQLFYPFNKYGQDSELQKKEYNVLDLSKNPPQKDDDAICKWYTIAREYKDIPFSVNVTPITLEIPLLNKKYKLGLHSGFLGVVKEENSVKPLLGYNIVGSMD
jgi:hypothetical protein